MRFRQMQGGGKMNTLAYSASPDPDYSGPVDLEFNILVIDERNRERSMQEVKECNKDFGSFLGYTINYELVGSFEEASEKVSQGNFYAAVTWVRKNRLEKAIDFAFFNEGKLETLMMKTEDLGFQEARLRKYAPVMPATNLYEASEKILEQLIN